jgi:hypothetical protein
MTKTTHTHRGTCQACGHVQAVDNVTRLVALHGYTVDWGCFNGTCGGSGKNPAELNTAYTHTIIAMCDDHAKAHEAAVANLKSGKFVPLTFERYNPTKVVTHKSRRGQTYQTTGGNDTLPIAEATKDERTKAINLSIHDNELHASGYRSHAAILVKHILPRLGMDLYPALEVMKAEAKAAKAKAVEGVRFPTKASRKDALDKLNRRYEKLRELISDAYLAGDRGERGRTLYYAAHQLNQWRPHHSGATRELYPQLASTVDAIEALVAEREEVKTAV